MCQICDLAASMLEGQVAPRCARPAQGEPDLRWSELDASRNSVSRRLAASSSLARPRWRSLDFSHRPLLCAAAGIASVPVHRHGGLDGTGRAARAARLSPAGQPLRRSTSPQPIVAARGEIHRYVGDELIATWKLEEGIADGRCVAACFAAIDRLA